MTPLVCVDHQGNADSRSAHLGDDCIVGGEKFIGIHRFCTGFVTDVDNQVLLMVSNQLESFVAKPEFHRFHQAIPVARRVMNFRDGNHSVRNALGNDIVQVADTTAGIPNNSNAVCAGFCNFRNRLAFTVGPNEHVVDATEDDLFVILAV